MKRLLLWGIGLAGLLLAACGGVLLVPLWVTDLEQSHYYNYGRSE